MYNYYMKTKKYKQLLHRYLFIVLSLIVSFIFMGCVSTKEITTEAECREQEGYWYNEICWDDFAPDAFITKENIDTFAEESLNVFEKTGNVIINEVTYPIESFVLRGIDVADLTVSLLFKNENKEYISMIQFIPGVLLAEEADTINSNVVLLKGNIDQLALSENSEALEDIEEIINVTITGDFEKLKTRTDIMGFGNLSAKIPNTESSDLELEGNLTNPSNSQEYSVTSYINETLIGWGNSTITVQENEAFIDGTLGTGTYIQMKNLIENNPQVQTVVLGIIDGSVNDLVNVHTGRILREAGLNTKVLSNSAIYSGGVDLFIAGVERMYEDGAKIGVHSWCCVEDKTARELSELHPAHMSQLEYATMALGEIKGPYFYFYTLEAAPFDDVYEMTKDELIEMNVVTQLIEK